MTDEKITPGLLLSAYRAGFFPMAESRDSDSIGWYKPEWRGILPLDRFHVPSRLARTVRQDVFLITADTAFESVMHGCAEPASGRTKTWINDRIIALYTGLHDLGHAHSIECWRDGALVGGLYGVSMGAAFFGESMFSRRRDASKVALVWLVARLRAGGYRLLDAQFITPHLEQFGAIEIFRSEYEESLADALAHEADFYSLPESLSGKAILQSVTQTS